MIWLTKGDIDVTTSQVSLEILINAKAAGISDSYRIIEVESVLNRKIDAFSVEVRKNKNYNESEQELKEYLCSDLFKYSVDVLAVNDFIYYLKKKILNYANNVAIAGHTVLYKYKYYKGLGINVVKVGLGTSDVVYFTIQIDASVAGIRNRNEKVYNEAQLSQRFRKITFEMTIGNETRDTEESLRVYLRDDLFAHFIDFVVVETFIDDFKAGVTKFMNDINKMGSEFVFEYKNHPWEKEEQEERKRWWKK